MDGGDHEQQDTTDSAPNPLTLCYVDQVWLQQFPLNPNTVLDYFANSQFYDRECNNEVIKMQRMDPSNLQDMTGIEYVVRHSQEPAVLYVIMKQRRDSRTSTVPLELYYVIEGTIYQCPDMAALANSRMATVLHYVGEAFEEAAGYVQFHPTEGYRWVKRRRRRKRKGGGGGGGPKEQEQQHEEEEEENREEGGKNKKRRGSKATEEEEEELNHNEEGDIGLGLLSGGAASANPAGRGSAKSDLKGVWRKNQHQAVDVILASLFAKFPLPKGVTDQQESAAAGPGDGGTSGIN
eukprot:Nk52_evm6s284 gene=Nk52_evmTU6s284